MPAVDRLQTYSRFAGSEEIDGENDVPRQVAILCLRTSRESRMDVWHPGNDTYQVYQEAEIAIRQCGNYGLFLQGIQPLRGVGPT